MGRIGIGEVIVIALVIVVLFGAKKLPEIGNALGEAIRNFKQASKEVEKGINDSIENKNQNKT